MDDVLAWMILSVSALMLLLLLVQDKALRLVIAITAAILFWVIAIGWALRHLYGE